MFAGRKTSRSVFAVIFLGVVALVALYYWKRHRPPAPPSAPFTLAERVAEIGPRSRERLAPAFESAGLVYPPARVLLVACKHERVLQLYAANSDTERPRYLTSYPILGASGQLGPKLREGDRQVPEGFYRLQALNPNSRFHVSVRVNYPNAFDLAKAEVDGRTTPGTDIFIHGSDRSVGCLAMGDPAAEDLFTLAFDTGLERCELLISPVDYRVTAPPSSFAPPGWMTPVYDRLKARIRDLPVPPQP